MRLNMTAAAAIVGMCLSMPLMAGSALSESLVAAGAKVVKSISPEELKKMIDKEEKFTMLDIRESYMRPEGNIDTEAHVAIGRGVLEFDVESAIPDKKALVVVYCRSGKGAVLSAKTLLQDMGYSNVLYLKGGMEAWLEAGYPLFNHFGEMAPAQ